MTHTCHHAQLFSVEMGVSRTFSPGWLGTMILPISASQVARITDVSNSHTTVNLALFNLTYHSFPSKPMNNMQVLYVFSRYIVIYYKERKKMGHTCNDGPFTL
jgi:hypothetical protein